MIVISPFRSIRVTGGAFRELLRRGFLSGALFAFLRNPADRRVNRRAVAELAQSSDLPILAQGRSLPTWGELVKGFVPFSPERFLRFSVFVPGVPARPKRLQTLALSGYQGEVVNRRLQSGSYSSQVPPRPGANSSSEFRRSPSTMPMIS